MTEDFSSNASASTAGYLYQIRYALFLLLCALETGNDIIGKVEGLDDISFERNGSALELIQTKHHINKKASLSNASPEIWKTLRIWSVALSQQNNWSDETILTLITTGIASNNSAASKLRPNTLPGRDAKTALQILVQTANNSKNTDNKDSYEAFLKLTESQRKLLVESIQIVDSSPNIIDTKQKILAKLKLSTRPQFLEPVYERLEAWWINRVIIQLLHDQPGISTNDLQAQINDIQDGYYRENLPIEFLDALIPEEPQLSKNERIFIEQLRLITISQPRIQKAISDYYCAYKQRCKWVRDGLLHNEDLEIYERRLIDEWERRYLTMKEEFGEDVTEDQKQKEGKALFKWVDQQATIHIRPRCTEPYVMRGSYHILANTLKIGWHADFYMRLCQLISEAMGET